MKALNFAVSAVALSLSTVLLLADGIEAQTARKVRTKAPQVEFDPEQGKAGVSDFAKPPVVDESYDRGIRRNIPVLQTAKRSEKRYVDPDELYERRLAMYDDSATFNRMLARTDSASAESETAGDAAKSPKKANPIARVILEKDSMLPLLLLAALLVTGFIIYFGAFRRGSRSRS